MKLAPQHTAYLVPSLTAAAVLCAFTGCWETIEYKGTSSSAESTEQLAPPVTLTNEQLDADPVAAPPVAAESVAATIEPDAEPPSSDQTLEPTEPAPSTISEESPAPPAEAATPPTDSQATPVDPYATPNASADTPPEAPPTANNSPPPGDGENAKTVSTAVDSSEQQKSPNTRHASWILGSRLSLAALANDRGVSAANVPKWFNEAKAAAATLGTTVHDLPLRTVSTNTSTASTAVLEYLLSKDGPRLGHELQTRFGPDHAALLELGVKTSTLILLYSPDSKAVPSTSKAIQQASTRAGLPAEIDKPLLDLLGSGASISEVRNGVRRFHEDVDRFLTTPAEQ